MQAATTVEAEMRRRPVPREAGVMGYISEALRNAERAAETEARTKAEHHFDEVVAQQRAKGRTHYGTGLNHDDGHDWSAEALQEAIDCAQYLAAENLRQRDELACLRAENQRLTAELRGPGGFIECQELTGEILRSALEGSPEADADLPHPRPANRAAAAIVRLTAERDEARSPTEGIGKLVRELHEAKAAAESALPALRERAENAEARLALVAGWVDENAGEHDLPDEVAHWVEVAMGRCDDDGFPIEVKT